MLLSEPEKTALNFILVMVKSHSGLFEGKYSYKNRLTFVFKFPSFEYMIDCLKTIEAGNNYPAINFRDIGNHHITVTV